MRIFKKRRDIEELPPELEELHAAVAGACMPESVEKVARKELDKLAQTSPSCAEYTIGINYLQYLASLPWNLETSDNLDMGRAESILEEGHYGLRKIKDRILEHLAVRILRTSRRPRVLVVDDEKTTRRNLEHVLSKEGYEVFTAANGIEATGMLGKGCFDVILTDLKMENVDGIGVLERAKAKDPATQVVIITGYATVPTAVTAMKKGSYEFLAKPLKLDQIRATVKNALAKKTQKLQSRGPVLCFAGPPGTGKTSLGMAIAKSLERKFIRMSLAGLKDEAQIRGHRRSYVGALPGRIIQEIRRAESINPVFMLDELDKLGQDFKGDPGSALLEVLDPEQNAHFIDHYLDVPFDLSRVMFIATANTVDLIPGPLVDRLEVLYLSGYTDAEKEQIAFRYLIPREMEEAGLASYAFTFTPEAVRKIIREYTREAGLRNLQRQIAALCRKTARQVLNSDTAASARTIGPEQVEAMLGPRKYYHEIAEAVDRVGIATGLAWTQAGGEIIFVEATRMKGKGKLLLTGSLGNIMKESAQAALSYIRSHTERWHIPEDFFETHDIHVHVPAGATPKDGPSAGLTIAIALLSVITGRPARREVALSGELTLSGRILPVGGIKEKSLAAHRAGVTCVVFPKKNEADLSDIPKEIRSELEIVTVNRLENIVDRVLKPLGKLNSNCVSRAENNTVFSSKKL
ncbi:MAG: endopeptidase La [Deltaproteobacteria bacterium]|nr:endopeptidase La [Deltaproteobacteria bacterium]